MILPIDKPAGMTSHDVVNRIRKAYGLKKVGHAGTLDPFATGVLIILIGRQSTKKSQEYMGQAKQYLATMKLGFISDTHDRDGQIQPHMSQVIPSQDTIQDSLERYQGDIEQIPPMHSAIKIGGKKLYQLARKGQTIDRPPRHVTIHDIQCVRYQYPFLTLRVMCSSGTYIRALARDIGADLGTGAYLEELIRERSGEITLDQCYRLENLPPLEESKM